MDSCPECRAFLQPDWDRCKICGHVLGTPTTAEAAAAGGKRRRAKRPPAEPAMAAAPSPPRTREPAAAPAGRRPAPPVTTPPLFADDAPPTPARRSSGGSGSRLPWLVGGLVVLAAAVVAYLVLGGDDGPDPYADRPAGESAEGEAEAVEALGDWASFPVGSVSVELPAPPFVEESVEQILVIGEMAMVRGETLSGGITYTVASGQLPDAVADREPDELMGRVVDRWATAEAGSVVSSEQITVDGNPAVYAVIDGLERDTHLVVIVDGQTLVELRVAGQQPDPLVIQRLIDTYES
jgi:hypothetical protein